MKLPKRIERIRKEMSDRHRGLVVPTNICSERGFDAACELLLPVIEEMKEKWELIITNESTWTKNRMVLANKALQSYKTLMVESDE